MYKVILCDDEEWFLELEKEALERVFKEFNEDFQIYAFSSGEALLEIEDINDYGIAFIDCELRTMDGIDVAKHIRKKGYEGIISFVSSYIKYSPGGYIVNAFRFIMKGQYEIGLRECIKAVIKNNAAQYFEIPDKEAKVKKADILYFESSNHKIILYLKSGKEHIIYGKLNDIEKSIIDSCNKT